VVCATVILPPCIELGKPCELITWNRSYALCRRLAEQIRESGFRPDIIVAIGRGGWVPGRILADFFDLMDLTSFKIEHYHGPHKQKRAMVKYPLTAHISSRQVLLVDDVSDSGDTFEIALEHLSTRGSPAVVRTAVIHHKVQSRYTPDFYARKIVKWRWLIYPWALMEDLTTFVGEIKPVPRDAREIAVRLNEEHGIRLSPQTLQDLCRILEETTVISSSQPNHKCTP